MTMDRRFDDWAFPCEHYPSRQLSGRPLGLTWTETQVLIAACEEALHRRSRNVSLSQIAARLPWIGESMVEAMSAIDALAARHYLYADDAPGLSDMPLRITDEGFDAYAVRFVDASINKSTAVLNLVAECGPGVDSIELAGRLGLEELLVEHYLHLAESSGLLGLSVRGERVTVEFVNPQLRRLKRGVA